MILNLHGEKKFGMKGRALLGILQERHEIIPGGSLRLSRGIVHALAVSTSRRKRFSHWLGASARAYDGQ